MREGAASARDHAWDAAPPIDVLLVPGGDTRAVSADERVLGRVRDLASADKLVTSVCTGAFVLHAAGLLDSRPATTHRGSIDSLRNLGVDVRPDARFVDAGAVVTAAGVSAGIDMALHLVARLHSRERAQEVRRYIQYDPEPPV